MAHENFGMSHRQLYDLACRVIDKDDTITSKDCEIAVRSGFVTYEIDVEGPYPSPTAEFIFWMDRFNPAPCDC